MALNRSSGTLLSSVCHRGLWRNRLGHLQNAGSGPAGSHPAERKTEVGFLAVDKGQLKLDRPSGYLAVRGEKSDVAFCMLGPSFLTEIQRDPFGSPFPIHIRQPSKNESGDATVRRQTGCTLFPNSAWNDRLRSLNDRVHVTAMKRDTRTRFPDFPPGCPSTFCFKSVLKTEVKQKVSFQGLVSSKTGVTL